MQKMYKNLASKSCWRHYYLVPRR